MSRLGRLWRTVRHLRSIQIFGRAHFMWHRPKLDMRLAPPLRPVAGAWQEPAAREASLTGSMTLRFLSVERSLEDCGWDRPEIDRLWRYNLHYFDDLNAQGAELRRGWQRALMGHWLIGNPPPQGTAWEPYPISLRVVNWIKFFLSGQAPEPEWLHSLAIQVRWLRRRLEWHLLGNHLFVNAKALVFAGLYFEGAEARDWLACGLRILQREMPEQILVDGGQFERSPMYHALALEDLLDLLNLIAARGDAKSPAQDLVIDLRQRATRMLHWLRCMSHPDGSLGLFNDSAQGVAPDNIELEAYASRLDIQAPHPSKEGFTDLPASGYLRAAFGPAVALLDMAPIGPDYLVGHAHADTLAFELSVHGQRVVVNGGTSCYGLSAQRLRERGTGWHSTVQIGSADSSEVWSGFRVGRRACILQRQLKGGTACATHDGWSHLPGAPLHQRCWTLSPEALVVDDQLESTVAIETAAVAHFHLAPGLSLHPEEQQGCWAVTANGQILAQIQVEAGEGRKIESLHAPRFGLLQPACALAVTLIAGRARTRWHWNLHAHLVSN